MKRTPLTRKTRLRARRRPAPGPVSPEAAAEKAELRARQEAFKRAVDGLRCVVCGKTRAEAYRATGYGHQAHHAVRQEVLKRLGLLDRLWDTDNALCLCEEPCHRRHTSRHARITRAQIGATRWRDLTIWAGSHGLLPALEREYPE